MNLTKDQKLKIERFSLYVESIALSMWLNVLYEFDNQIVAWQKCFGTLLDEGLTIKNTQINKIYRFMKYYLYTDNSDKKLYPNKPLFLSQSYIILSNLRVDKLTKYFPLEYRVKSVERTDRYEYKKERRSYKLCHNVASSGNDIKERYYEEYKCIASKYNWPFIVNSNDPEY